jgi:hypothetical protein
LSDRWFDVAATHVHGESLLSPAGGKGEENCLWFAKHRSGFHGPDGASWYFRDVHAFDASSGDDRIAFAIANFSYPQTYSTLNAAR